MGGDRLARPAFSSQLISTAQFAHDVLREARPRYAASSTTSSHRSLKLDGLYRLTSALRSALRASTATGGARVVNLASMSALRAVTFVPGDGSSKASIGSPSAMARVGTEFA